MPSNNIFTIYTPSLFGRSSFPLRHKDEPIFYKQFNSADSEVVDLNNDIITIPNHFFKTGEPLKYTTNLGGTKIGIASSSPGAAGITTQLPQIVYPIVVDKNNIKLSLGSTYAQNNENVDLTTLGIGTHSFEAFKQNSKVLISVDNIIQSPISVASTVQVLSYTQSSLTVNSLQNIKIGTCIKVNDEIVKVAAINYDTNTLTLLRGTNVLGTDVANFGDSILNSYVEILGGNYNIIKDVIYFDDPPFEGKKITYDVPASDINFSNFSFNLFSSFLNNGFKVLVVWANPPQELQSQDFYYIIKNDENNFSFSNTFAGAFNSIKTQFSDVSNNEFPVSGFKVIFFFPSEDSTFSGRVFLRSNYDGNLVFDDVSEKFTGITSSFELTSSGISTVGISSDNGILLINNIFQYPGSDEAFSFVGLGTTGTAVNFVGFGTTGFTGKTYDVNVKGYPRGGIIVSYGSTSGSLYEPLKSYDNVPLSGSASGIGASVSFETDQYGNVSNFKFTNRGYNYKVGEVLVPLYTTGIGTQSQDNKIHITINEVTKDTFNSWNIGILDKLDDLTAKVNGTRKTFVLTKNGKTISFDSNTEFEIELQYNLLIFVNDILQIPNVSYTYKNGSIVTFTEPIPTGSSVKVYFYKGYVNDTFISPALSRLKIGDILQVQKDIYNPPPLEEKNRVIKEFTSADILRTNIYTNVGISDDSSQMRAVTWTPQKSDLILDGEFVSKSRPDQNSGITSFTKMYSYVGTFSGINTSLIGINTTGIMVGDYVEGDYVGTGVTIVSIGSSIVGVGSTSYITSPVGVNTALLSLYRKS